LFAAKNIIQVIKLRMRWMGHVACLGDMRNAYKIFVGKPEGMNHLEDVNIDGKIMFEWYLGKEGGRMCTGFIWLRIGASDRPL
jgi:hypothetical protein